MAPSLDPADSLPEALAVRLAAQAAQVMQDLPNRLHPAWIESAHVDRSLLTSGSGRLLNTVLQARFDLCWPDLSAARHALEWAWLLPAGQLQRLCAARALFEVRGTLSRTLDAAFRRSARTLLGDESFDTLVRWPTPRRDEAACPPFDADAVTVGGWALLNRQIPWGHVRSRRLVAMMLPPAARCPGSGAWCRRSTAWADFEAAASNLFPEHRWLIGSRPASLRSA